MIRVNVACNEDQKITGYTMKGHSFQGEPGSDIVCASASTLGLATLNTLTDVCDLEDKIDYEYGEGLIAVSIDYESLSSQERRDVNIVLEGFRLNIESLVDQYPDNISLT